MTEQTAPTLAAPSTKSKTLATWLAVIGGGLGLHRFYLHGGRDLIGWLHPLPTLLGVIGLMRAFNLGQDDRLAWVLMPFGGLSIAAGMLAAIVNGLQPDERWNARHNPGIQPCGPAGWPVVIGVIVALFVGAVMLTSVISFTLQRLFESQL
ncbi:MAG: hypothetical protein AB9M60_10615 [Leptothrix sp. (in: b-proteobacteria)]